MCAYGYNGHLKESLTWKWFTRLSLGTRRMNSGLPAQLFLPVNGVRKSSIPLFIATN